MAAGLLAELDSLGMQLEADGDRLCFHPRERATAALVERMRACKTELIAMVLRRKALENQVAQQLAQLVPYRGPDGRCGWVHPRYRDELERLGF